MAIEQKDAVGFLYSAMLTRQKPIASMILATAGAGLSIDDVLGVGIVDNPVLAAIAVGMIVVVYKEGFFGVLSWIKQVGIKAIGLVITAILENDEFFSFGIGVIDNPVAWVLSGSIFGFSVRDLIARWLKKRKFLKFNRARAQELLQTYGVTLDPVRNYFRQSNGELVAGKAVYA